jgi:hypothetical protein
LLSAPHEGQSATYLKHGPYVTLMYSSFLPSLSKIVWQLEHSNFEIIVVMFEVADKVKDIFYRQITR